MSRPKPRFRLYKEGSMPHNGTWLVWDSKEKMPLVHLLEGGVKVPRRFMVRADARKAAKEATDAQAKKIS